MIPQEVIVIDSKDIKKYFIMPMSTNELSGSILGDIATFSKICKQQTEATIQDMDIKSQVNLFLKYYKHIEIIFNKEGNHNVFTINFTPYIDKMKQYYQNKISTPL